MLELQSGRRGIHGERLNGHIVDCVRRREITFQPRDLSLLAHSVLRPARGSLCWPRSSWRVFSQIKRSEITFLFPFDVEAVFSTQSLSSDDLSVAAQILTLFCGATGLCETLSAASPSRL